MTSDAEHDVAEQVPVAAPAPGVLPTPEDITGERLEGLLADRKGLPFRRLWRSRAKKGRGPGHEVNCNAVSRVIADYVNRERPDDPVDELQFSDRVTRALYGDKDERRHVSLETLNLFIDAFEMTEYREELHMLLDG
jgi:hypothetical protein